MPKVTVSRTADDTDAFDADDMTTDEPDDTLGVADYLATVNDALKIGLRGVWVQGEITAFKRDNNKGHIYFSLVEEVDGEQHTLKVTFWAGRQRGLQSKLAAHDLELADGMKVRITGKPQVYPVYGNFSLVLDDIDPTYTLGDLVQRREEVLRRLKEQGLFDKNRRTVLPLVPLRLAVITSVGTAANEDVMKTLAESRFGFQIAEYDVRVQGPEAPGMIANALQHASRRDDLDAVLLIRGGGAKNELAIFDDEGIALAIARCRHPVLTGIGHETDRTIADEVAFSGFKTPTACAKFVVDRVDAFVDRLDQAWQRTATQSMQILTLVLARLDNVAQRVRTGVLTALQHSSERLAVNANRLQKAPAACLTASTSRLDDIADRLRLLDPVHLMKRGWSITRSGDGRVMRDVRQVKKNETLTTRVANGTVTSTVVETESIKTTSTST
ncbi:MAG: exodeoxyribonuclease VII large subunit [Actinobacteria bacterium]|nr:exodeoxyribonuclease VII large subunit [Actinomycetota bacterium]